MDDLPVTTGYEYRWEDIEPHALRHRAGTLEADCDCDRCALYEAIQDGRPYVVRPHGDGTCKMVFVYI